MAISEKKRDSVQVFFHDKTFRYLISECPKEKTACGTASSRVYNECLPIWVPSLSDKYQVCDFDFFTSENEIQH